MASIILFSNNGKGFLDGVTTLIGLTVNNVAKLGVVGNHYLKTAEGKYEFKPRCYFSHADVKQVYCIDYANNREISKFEPVLASDPNRYSLNWSSMNYRFYVITSRTSNNTLENYIKKIQPQNIIREGALKNSICYH